MQKLQELTLPGYISIYLTTFLFLTSIYIFCTLFICILFDGLLWSIYFWKFCSKQSITFEKTYLLSCWLHSVDIFYIKFRFSQALRVIKSVTSISLIEALYIFRTIKYWFARLVCFRFVWIELFWISRLALSCFTFLWYLCCVARFITICTI